VSEGKCPLDQERIDLGEGIQRGKETETNRDRHSETDKTRQDKTTQDYTRQLSLFVSVCDVYTVGDGRIIISHLLFD
jgi:hypothetical protein